MILNTPTHAHVLHYAQIVVDLVLRRDLISAGGNIAALGYDQRSDVPNLLERANHLLLASGDRRGRGEEYVTAEQAATAFYDRLEFLQSGSHQASGIPSGYAGLRH